MGMNDDKKDIQTNLDEFLGETGKTETQDCEECKITTDKSIVERINKKIITEDGRQLLI